MAYRFDPTKGVPTVSPNDGDNEVQRTKWISKLSNFGSAFVKADESRRKSVDDTQRMSHISRMLVAMQLSMFVPIDLSERFVSSF